ncbi:MAG: hypothetical protein II965_03375 [Pyramidobacter sp.]|nr:hypothetical protein [Pyramidobacter sp.]
MKKIHLLNISLLFFCFLVSSPLYAQIVNDSDKSIASQKESVAIDDIIINESVVVWAKKNGRYDELKRIKDTLQSEFSTSMSRLRVFKVIERRNIESLQREQVFADTFVDPNDPNKAKELAAAGGF